jgi:hypothetical protein
MPHTPRIHYTQTGYRAALFSVPLCKQTSPLRAIHVTRRKERVTCAECRRYAGLTYKKNTDKTLF